MHRSVVLILYEIVQHNIFMLDTNRLRTILTKIITFQKQTVTSLIVSYILLCFVLYIIDILYVI